MLRGRPQVGGVEGGKWQVDGVRIAGRWTRALEASRLSAGADDCEEAINWATTKKTHRQNHMRWEFVARLEHVVDALITHN